jgi:hypothetical protein
MELALLASRLGKRSMVVFGHRTFRLNTAEFLRRFRGQLQQTPDVPAHDAIVGLLVDWGEAESAVADALQPERDDDAEALCGWRRVSDALADALCASWDHRPHETAAAIALARIVIDTITSDMVPAETQARTAEGFALYGTYPEQYIEAADVFVRSDSPARVMCIGLRRIGSILAHVVAAAFRRRGITTVTRSVRPRGHPFDRRLIVSRRLGRTFASCHATHFVIVDEGPGLSGSSFAASADYLVGIGVPPDQIVLFPSWKPAATQLRSARAQTVWVRHQHVTSDFERVWLHGGRMFGTGRTVEDISAGGWRNVLIRRVQEHPAVQPQHERRKYRTVERVPALLKFVGLGSRGISMRDRGLVLAQAGFGPSVRRLLHGFLEQAWISGRPIMRATAATLDHVASYITCVRRSFATSEPESIEFVTQMVVANLAEDAKVEHVDSSSVAAVERLAQATRAYTEPLVAVDGRMLPYEWIATDDRIIETDALDHHADDFWPGCRDIAWDVAGAIVEFDLDASSAEYLVNRYQRESGDATIRHRLPFFEVAYLAYRSAYARLAADTLGQESADGGAFKRLAARYRRSLAVRLASCRPASRC